MDEAPKTQANLPANQLQNESPPRQEEQSSPRISSRQRPADDDSSSDEPLLKITRLTRKNLALFDKMGKKDSSGLSDDSKSTRTTSTTTSGFIVKARKNGILIPTYSKPPMNLDDLRKQQAKSRGTASPPESAYENYVNQVDRAGNEATLVAVASNKLLKEYTDKGYNSTYDRAFTNLPKNIGFNNGLSAPQPDFIEGLELEEYYPFPVDECVPEGILYKDDARSLALPHIAGEWEGPDGNLEEARLQSAYDGAALVHARNQALAHIGKPDPPGHAKITTFTTDGTTLNLYAHYAVPSAVKKDTLEYHQYPVSSINIKGTYQGHKDGRRSLRNAQDHARDQSYNLKTQLKEHWEKNNNGLQPDAEGALLHASDMEALPPAPDGYEEAGLHVVAEEGGEEDCEIVQPTAHRESSRYSSHHSSSHSSNRKRKASSSQTSSHGSSRHIGKHGSYWKKNSEGHYYHKHSDGTVTWYDAAKDHQ